MANKTFEARGHIFYRKYLSQGWKFGEVFFLFSIGHRISGSTIMMKYYYFIQTLPKEVQTAFDRADVRDRVRLPGRHILARADFGVPWLASADSSTVLGSFIPKNSRALFTATGANESMGDKAIDFAWINLHVHGDRFSRNLVMRMKWTDNQRLRSLISVTKFDQVPGIVHDAGLDAEYAMYDPWKVHAGVDLFHGEEDTPHY